MKKQVKPKTKNGFRISKAGKRLAPEGAVKAKFKLPPVSENDLKFKVTLNNETVSNHPLISQFLREIEDGMNSKPEVQTALLAILGGLVLTGEAAMQNPSDASDLV